MMRHPSISEQLKPLQPEPEKRRVTWADVEALEQRDRSSGYSTRSSAAQAARRALARMGVMRAFPDEHFQIVPDGRGTYGFALHVQAVRPGKQTTMNDTAIDRELSRDPSPRAPSWEEKARVRRFVEEHYDEAEGHWVGGYSDAKAAEALEVSVFLVATIRDTFGPNKTAVQAHAAVDLEPIRDQVRAALEALQAAAKALGVE